jgi:hypothetical protein
MRTLLFKCFEIVQIILNQTVLLRNYMLNLDLLIFPVMGFAAAYLSLETAWHFTACKSHHRDLKPCVFKQVKEMAARHY